MKLKKKMSFGHLFGFALRYFREPLLYKFVIVGLMAAIFALAFTWIFTTFFAFIPPVSVFFAWELCAIWSFVIFEKWGFSKINKKHPIIIRFIFFHLITGGALLINESVLVFLTTQFHTNYLLAEFFGMLTGFLVNYNLNKKFSWARRFNR